ncbi:MAG: hypothetical protein O7A03_01055 [Alphaproteobacteria bacterium]|nr:hypothetical protein [Alphaproteobacteria bacterium]
MFKGAGAIGTVLAVSACAGSQSVLLESAGSLQEARTELGPSREFNHFASGKDLYTEIYGNPFGMDDNEFRNEITGILNARNSLVPTNFTVKPGPSADPAYRAVLVFNGAGHYNGWTLCRGPKFLGTRPQKGNRIKIDMAFCNGRDELHSVTGTLPATASPSDPSFENSLALTLALAQPTDESSGN